MIGEAVLSLLIVQTIETSDYFVIAFLGVLNVMCIQFLIFESQPSTLVGHAIFRSLESQIHFSLLVQTLSMGLIVFGVSFKIMLQTVVWGKMLGYRRLAASKLVDTNFTVPLFSISLTVILITLELMFVSHKGTKETFSRLWKHRDVPGKGIKKEIHKSLLALHLAKFGIIIFGPISANLWEMTLAEISLIGLSIVFAIFVSRLLIWELVSKEDKFRVRASDITKPTANNGRRSSLGDIEEEAT